MSKQVACQGDVIATAGTVFFTGAQAGAWVAGEVQPVLHPELQVSGSDVISAASCTFAFTGTNAGGAAITGTEVVTLTAGATKLRTSQAAVLAEGDQATGPGGFGNQLTVSASRKLRTG
jgi:hypothetical protein